MINDLLRRIAEREKPAFEELREIVAYDIKIIAVTYAPFYHQEIMQEVYLRIWRHADKFVPFKDGRYWIKRIAHNVAVDFYKKLEKEKRRYCLSTGDYIVLEKSAFDRIDDTGDLLKGLSDDEKYIVLMKVVKYRYKEIALIKNWSIDRITNLNRSAKQKILKNLERRKRLD